MIDIIEFHNRIADDVTNNTPEQIDIALIDTIIDFCEKTEILKYTFSYNIEEGEVDEFNHNYFYFPVELINSDNIAWRINNLYFDNNTTETKLYYKVIPPNSARTHVATDSLYYYFVDSNVVFYPIRGFNQITFDVVCKPSRLATTVEDIIFEDHVDTILAGTKGRLFVNQDKDRNQNDLAMYFKDLYDLRVKNVRTEQTRNKTTRSGRVKYKSFIY